MWAPVEGRYGRTRDGRKVGPMVPSGRGDRWPWDACGHSEAPGMLWTATGRYSLNGSDHPLDLVAEWVDDGLGHEILSPKPLCEAATIIQTLQRERDAANYELSIRDDEEWNSLIARAEAAEQQVRDMREGQREAFMLWVRAWAKKRFGVWITHNTAKGAFAEYQESARLLLKDGGE